MVKMQDTAVEGITSVFYDLSSKQFRAVNHLGEVCYLSSPSDETVVISDQSVSSLSFRPNGEEVAVGVEGEVQIRGKDLKEVLQPAAVRSLSSLAITALQYSSSGQHLFVSSEDDSGIAVYSTITRTVELKIKTLNTGVRSFVLDDSGTYLAAVTLDGTLLIHKLLFEEGPLRRQYNSYDMVCVKTNVVKKDLCRNMSRGYNMSFQSHALPKDSTAKPSPATQIVFAHQDGSPILLSREDGSDEWTEKHFLVTSEDSDCSHLENDVNLVSFSPNGLYLLTADVEGRVLVWKTRHLDDKNKSTIDAIKMIQLEEVGEGLVHIAWGPNDDDNYALVVSADKEQTIEPIVNTSIGFCRPCGEVEEEKEQMEESDEKEAEEKKSDKPIQAGKRLLKKPSKPEGKLSGADDASEEGDDFFDDVSLEKLKQEHHLSENNGADGVEGSSGVEGYDEDGDGDDYDDDQGEVTVQPSAIATAIREQELKDLLASTAVDRLPPPFQPSSTCRPAAEDSYEYGRKEWSYLVWNAVGSITTLHEGAGNRVEVNFSDVQGPNKHFTFQDVDLFSKAALSNHGAAFASDFVDHDEEKERVASVLVYRAFASSQAMIANESFKFTLPMGESVTAVACGKGFVAVATSQRLLRVFSATGLQLSVSMLKGPVMCLVGGGPYLGVLYFAGSQPDQSHSLILKTEVMDFSRSGCRLVTSAELTLDSNESINWAGFSDEGVLCVTEENGTLYGLLHSMGWQWVPLLDTRPLVRTEQHHLWPVAVKSGRLCFVMLNGESRPGVHPKPVVTSRPFRLPTIDVPPKSNPENERARVAALESMQCTHWGNWQQEFLEVTQREGGMGSVSVPTETMTVEDVESSLEERRLQLDKASLRHFHECCKTRRTGLALDIVSRLYTISGLENAITIANHTGRVQLAQVVEDLLSERQLAASEDAVGGSDALPSQSTSQLPPHSQNHDQQDDFHHDYDHYQGYSSPEQSASSITQNRLNLAKRSSLAESQQHSKKASPRNPFAAPRSSDEATTASPVSASVSQSGKKRAVAAEASPSPKKTMLSRESSFAQEARWKRHHDRNVI